MNFLINILKIKKISNLSWSSQDPLNFKPKFKTILFLVLGLILFATGETLLITANQGVSPWTVLAQGISFQSNLSIGVTTFIVSIFVLLLWYPAYENLFSMIRKFRKELSPMLPDTNHFHQLVFYFLKKKFFITNIFANSLSANIINFYNGIIFLIASTNVSSTKFQIKLIFLNVIVYSLFYIFLYKFRSKKI